MARRVAQAGDRRSRAAGGTGPRLGRGAEDVHPVAVGAHLDGPGPHHRAGHGDALPAHRRSTQDAIDAGGHRAVDGAALPRAWTDEQRAKAATLLARRGRRPGRLRAWSRSSATATTRPHVRGARSGSAGWRFGRHGRGRDAARRALAATHAASTRPSAPTGGSSASRSRSRSASRRRSSSRAIRQRDTPPEHFADPAQVQPAARPGRRRRRRRSPSAGSPSASPGSPSSSARSAAGCCPARRPPGAAPATRSRSAAVVYGTHALWKQGHARHRGRHLEVRRGHGRVGARAVDAARRSAATRRASCAGTTMGREGRGTSSRSSARSRCSTSRPRSRAPRARSCRSRR